MRYGVSLDFFNERLNMLYDSLKKYIPRFVRI